MARAADAHLAPTKNSRRTRRRTRVLHVDHSDDEGRFEDISATSADSDGMRTDAPWSHVVVDDPTDPMFENVFVENLDLNLSEPSQELLDELYNLSREEEAHPTPSAQEPVRAAQKSAPTLLFGHPVGGPDQKDPEPSVEPESSTGSKEEAPKKVSFKWTQGSSSFEFTFTM